MRFNIGNDILPHEYKGAVYNHECFGRLRFLRQFFAVVFLAFIGRTIQLGLQNNDIGKGGDQNAELAKRADIVDRNGVVLAKSVKYGSIKLYPPRVKDDDVNAVANVIHEIAPMDYSVADALNLILSFSQHHV